MILEKYESTGNDILLASADELIEQGIEIKQEVLSQIAKSVCDRHFGIGADHFIVLTEPGLYENEFPGYVSDSDAHCRMIFFNSDGSSAEMSGNGIRCFALFAVNKGYGQKNSQQNHEVIVETLAGTRNISIFALEDGSYQGDVNMGQVSFEPEDIPYLGESTEDIPGMISGKQRRGMAANSGIPHWMLLLDDLDELNSSNIESNALMLRFDDRFPRNTNVDCVVVENENEVQARFFERGASETLSCGTGVTAVAAMLAKVGLCSNDVLVKVKGGELRAFQNDDKTWILRGPVRKIARCEFSN